MERPSMQLPWSNEQSIARIFRKPEPTLADRIMQQQLQQIRQMRQSGLWNRSPFALPPFTVSTGCARPEGYSDRHKSRINTQPGAMFEMLEEQGALCAQIPLNTETSLYCALAGSPYTDIRDSQATHFMAFVHQAKDPAFFDLTHLETPQVKGLVDLAFAYIGEDPVHRVAGFNLGPQNEEGVESPQGWANLHLQCFSLPHPTRRTLLSDTLDEQTKQFVARKRALPTTPLAPIASHVANESQLFFEDRGRVDRTSETPHQFTVRFPKGADHGQIAQYLQTLHEYLDTVHRDMMLRSHPTTTAPRPSKPIYTVGFGRMGDVEAIRISLLSGVRGSLMGVAESAFGVFPLRAANSANQSYDISSTNMATPDELVAFQTRTRKAAQRACEQVVV